MPTKKMEYKTNIVDGDLIFTINDIKILTLHAESGTLVRECLTIGEILELPGIEFDRKNMIECF